MADLEYPRWIWKGKQSLVVQTEDKAQPFYDAGWTPWPSFFTDPDVEITNEILRYEAGLTKIQQQQAELQSMKDELAKKETELELAKSAEVEKITKLKVGRPKGK